MVLGYSSHRTPLQMNMEGIPVDIVPVTNRRGENPRTLPLHSRSEHLWWREGGVPHVQWPHCFPCKWKRGDHVKSAQHPPLLLCSSYDLAISVLNHLVKMDRCRPLTCLLHLCTSVLSKISKMGEPMRWCNSKYFSCIEFYFCFTIRSDMITLVSKQ